MMRLVRRTLFCVPMLTVVVACLGMGAAAQINPQLYQRLEWRNIGPYHGGRVSAVTGSIAPKDTGTFYVGTPAGGIWKTTSAGTTWFPVFDDHTEVDGVGAIFVAPSDPNIVYAGTGDSVSGPNGTGMYKSTDAGKTWQHIGLEETTKINKLWVDPKDANLVLASTNRGVFRSTDGGANWTNTLNPEGTSGTRDLEAAFDMPNEIMAATQGGGGAGGGGGGRGGGAGCTPGAPECARLYKSMDEGKTWTQITTLPPYTGRIGVAVAMNTYGQRLYVVGGNMQGGSGLYRSDDGGQTWQHMAGNDTRISNGQGAYSCGVWVDSQDPDILYTVSTAAYQSTDGGKTFHAFKGAPGGEDMHDIWIDPTNGKRMLFGVDQGAPVTLDGGKTWSSYYQIPIAQTYHVSTDNRYPYWVLASQQDTGAVMERSRGDGGDVSETDWRPLASSEFGTVTADPTDPNIIYGVGYGAGQGAGLIKINIATGQWDNINPEYGADAAVFGTASRDQWRKFDPFDPHAMYADFQCLAVSRDQGLTWTAFSPALTTAKGAEEEKCGTPAPAGAAVAGRGRRGATAPATAVPGAAGATTVAGATTAAATVAPAGRGGRGGGGGSIADFDISTTQKGLFWTVSSNGQVFRGMAGKAGETWENVSNFTDATGVTFNTIVAGLDSDTAYVSGRAAGGGRGAAATPEAANASDAPLIWRTHDGGKTWTKIINGLPSGERTGSWVNVIRADPYQKGLLYAGTETTVFVSFDDGDHWQSLRENLPSTSIRDMVFHTDDHMSDLVICTYGRGFWILDDTEPLRELAAKSQQIASAPAYLFKPNDAIRSRISDNWDQPENPELPHAANPPFGVIFDYYLSHAPQGEVKVEVYDAQNNLIRTISSIPPTPEVGPTSWAYPDYWIATPQDLALPTQVGENRYNWDLRYDNPPSFSHDEENQMNIEVPQKNTPGPHGILASPGTYTLKLIVDGQTYTQTVLVRNDPRVGESAKAMAAIDQKHQVMLSAYNIAKDSFAGNEEVRAVRDQVTALTKSNLPTDLAAQATALDTKLALFGGIAPGGRGGRGGGGGFGGRGGAAGAAPPPFEAFNTVNGSMINLVSLQQNGDDDPPTPAVIATFEADCKNYDKTVTAWKAMQTQDLPAFNAALTKDGQQPLNVMPSKLTSPSCTLAEAPAPTKGKKSAGTNK